MTSGTGETRAVTQDGLAVATGIVGELFPDCPDCCTSQTDGDLCGPCKRALGIVVKAMGYADSAARSGTGETRDAAKRLIRALAKRSNPPLMERQIYPSGLEEAEQIAAAGLEAFASAALARAERAERALRELAAAAERVLLQRAHMDGVWGDDWAELEDLLEPLRQDCLCGAKGATPMHHDSAPYFCAVLGEPGTK